MRKAGKFNSRCSRQPCSCVDRKLAELACIFPLGHGTAIAMPLCEQKGSGLRRWGIGKTS